MNRKLLLLLVAVFTLGVFSSCEGPMGPIGPQGPTGPIGPQGPGGLPGEGGTGTSWHIAKFTVEGKDWKPYEDNLEGIEVAHFYYDIPVEELSVDMANDGAVLVSILDADGTNYPLPHMEYYYDSKDEVYFSENIKCDYSPGIVRIYIGASDLLLWQPPTYTFKITLIY